MNYDLVIIGAGPAGLMAGCRAAELGARVIILEKNKRAGLKLLSTGGGRCNFTNHILDAKKMAMNYEPNHHFLISAFSRFGAGETITFFNRSGVATKVEKNGRVFPTSNRADDILKSLLDHYIKAGGIIKYEAEVRHVRANNNKINNIILNSGELITGKKYLIATGGKSYPQTGSSGDGYKWLKLIGHEVIKPRPALAPIRFKEKSVSRFEGASLSDVELILFDAKKKIAISRGDMIFTNQGISGPAAHDLSRFIDPDSKKKYTITINLIADKSRADLDEYLQRQFHSGRKSGKNIIEKIIPPKITSLIFQLANINFDKQANAINRDEKNRLLDYLQKLSFSVSGLGDFEDAMVSAGGVSLAEVDPKTMASKIISNLYLAGEILNLTGPSGGYNLQLCWSTAYIAAESALK